MSAPLGNCCLITMFLFSGGNYIYGGWLSYSIHGKNAVDLLWPVSRPTYSNRSRIEAYSPITSTWVDDFCRIILIDKKQRISTCSLISGRRCKGNFRRGNITIQAIGRRIVSINIHHIFKIPTRYISVVR